MTVNFGMVNPTAGLSVMDMPILNAYSGAGMTMNGVTPYATPYAGGMYGGFGILNPQYQMQTMQQWDNFGIDRQVSMYQNQNNAQFRMQGQNNSIARQIQVLSSQIKADNQDNVKAEYDKLLAAVKSAYGSQVNKNLSPEDQEAQIRAYAEQLYAQQTGTYITDDIRANSSSSFMSGLKQILTFGFGNKTTADENISRIEGTNQTTKSKASKIAGNVVGGLLGGILAVGSFLLLKGKKA